MKHNIEHIYALVVFIGLIYIVSLLVLFRIPAPVEVVTIVRTVRDVKQETLQHRQDVWIHALEWCESGGRKLVINPNDSDGSPSYYSHQFKPTTFEMFAKKYKLIPRSTTLSEVMTLMQDYELTKQIIRGMMKDKTVKWEKQFPNCVKNKIGRPPLN